MFYNGWTHDHYVTNVFVLDSDETIPIFFNIAGCVHDSLVADWDGSNQKVMLLGKNIMFAEL